MDRRGLVFDFDGTMCRLFQNYDLSAVVNEMCVRMNRHGIPFSAEQDAFDVFDAIRSRRGLDAEQKKVLFREMNGVLVSAELDAVRNCGPVHGVGEILPRLYGEGYPIGIATNNSRECVVEFLNLYCNGLNVPVSGRIGAQPQLMKPDPFTLRETLRELNRTAADALFFGDTGRDHECAQRMRCKFVGVAPTEKKLKRLQEISPEIDIVSDFYELKEYVDRTSVAK